MIRIPTLRRKDPVTDGQSTLVVLYDEKLLGVNICARHQTRPFTAASRMPRRNVCVRRFFTGMKGLFMDDSEHDGLAVEGETIE